MTPPVKGVVYGGLVTCIILLGALVVSTPNGTTVMLAVAIGVAVTISTWYQERRRSGR